MEKANGQTYASKKPITITPEEALEILDKNTHNRKIKLENVNSIIHDLQHGHWQVNGDTIRIAPDGTLLDGQHRLSACEKSGIPLETFVVVNVPKLAQKTIDTGSKRSYVDVLTLRGETNPAALSSVIKLSHKMIDIYLPKEKQGKTKNFALASTNNSLRYIYDEKQDARIRVNATNDMLDDFYSDYKEELPYATDFAVMHKRKAKQLGLTIPFVGTTRFLLGLKDDERAEEFLETMLLGTNLEEIDMIYKLRDKLVNEVNNTSVTKKKKGNNWKFGIIFKTWNLEKNGRKLKNLDYREFQEKRQIPQ